MRYTATVDSIEIVHSGSFTIGVTATGATSLPVSDCSDFIETGGTAVLDGVPFTYSAAVTDDANGDTLTLTLALAADVPDRTPVLVDPPFVTKTAYVFLDSDLDRDEPIAAIIDDPALWADSRLAETTTGGQAVTVESHRVGRAAVWRVHAIDGVPIADLSYADKDKPITPGAVTTSLAAHRDLWANKVQPEVIGDGDLTGIVNVKGQVVSGDPTVDGVIQDAYGIRSIAGGFPKSVHPTDPDLPDTLRGNIDADQISIEQGAVHGPLDVAPGGSINLKSLVIPPPVAPTAVPFWSSVPVQFPPEIAPADRRGLAIKDFVYPLTEGYSLWIPPGKAPQLLVFNPDDGTFTGAFDFPPATTAAGVPYGVGYNDHDSQIMTLHLRPSVATPWVVRRWTFSGSALTFVSEWTWAEGEAFGPQPAFAVSAAVLDPDVLIARADATGTVSTWRYNKTGTLQHTQVGALTVDAARLDLAGIGLSTTTGMPVMQRVSDGQFYVTDDITAGTISAVAIPPTAYGDPLVCGCSGTPVGLLRDVFGLSGASNILYTYPGWLPYPVYSAAAAWVDTGSGDETLVGPVAVVNVIPCAAVTYSVGPAPSGADAVHYYLAAPPSFPLFYSQGITPAGVTSMTVLNPVFAGSHPLGAATLTVPPGGVGQIDVDGVKAIGADRTGEIYDLLAVGIGDIIGGSP